MTGHSFRELSCVTHFPVGLVVKAVVIRGIAPDRQSEDGAWKQWTNEITEHSVLNTHTRYYTSISYNSSPAIHYHLCKVKVQCFTCKLAKRQTNKPCVKTLPPCLHSNQNANGRAQCNVAMLQCYRNNATKLQCKTVLQRYNVTMPQCDDATMITL